MIEAIFIGTELCDGRTLNSNQHAIAKLLYKEGLYLKKSTTVDDTFEDLVSLFKEKLKTSNILITTGGLGPTEDDRTTAALASACELSLIRNNNELKKIKSYFQKTNRNMPTANAKQADFPEGSTIIDNPLGTAPGFYIKHKNTLIFCCPGVPKEVLPMIGAHVIPTILNIFPNLKKTHESCLFKCIGIGESHCQERLTKFYPLPNGIEISFQAKLQEIQIRLSKTETANTTLFNKLKLQLKTCLTDVCFSNSEDETLEHVIISLCSQHNFKISLAESCTGGLISQLLTRVPGASNVIDINFVTYSNLAKSKWLNVNADTLQAHGAVSAETVTEMATNTLKLTNSTFALSVSGIAGPTGGCKQKPVGTVYFGVGTTKQTRHYHKCFNGTREHIQQRAASTALMYLYNEIKEEIS
jgi:nicotinamide-nucleotide amidase